MAGQPTFYAEGNEPRRLDTSLRVEQKILGALRDGGGGGSGSQNPAFEIYPMGTAAPNDPSRPALRYTSASAPTTMEQWDVDTQQWF